MSSDSEGLTLSLDRAPGSAIAVLHSGDTMRYHEDAWRDALVLVQSGALRITCCSGRTAEFTRGSIVYFHGFDLASIGAAGPQDTVLLSLRRPSASSPHCRDAARGGGR